MTATSPCSKASKRSQTEKNNNRGHCVKTTMTGPKSRAGNERQSIACSESFSSHSLQR